VGADRGHSRQRQRGRIGPGLGAAGTAASPQWGGGGADGEDGEDALLAAGATRQIATVCQRQRAGEVELRESE
jgi:hypothetical protein